MTFSTIETSVSDGRPVELLQIDFGQYHWHYTTAEEEIVYNGNTYSPLPMEHDNIKPTGDTSKAGLPIRVPQDTPVGDLFRAHPPSGVVTVTLYALHFLDNDFKVIWKGRAINAEWQPPWLTLTTESVISSLQRVGLRRKYSSQCPHPLYGVGCGLSQESFKTNYNVVSLSGASVFVSGWVGGVNNYFAGGYAQWLHNTRGTVERRAIKSSNASTGQVVLSSLPLGLSAGQVVSLYAGCDHSLSTCNSKFGNSLNYGGTPFIPTKNPFGGSTLY